MKWNPQTLRWEGNDQVLRDFDAAVGTSVRPALITQLTGSSIGSPVGNIAGARVVGNMLFDPTRMCWVSTLPPEDEEVKTTPKTAASVRAAKKAAVAALLSKKWSGRSV